MIFNISFNFEDPSTGEIREGRVGMINSQQGFPFRPITEEVSFADKFLAEEPLCGAPDAFPEETEEDYQARQAGYAETVRHERETAAEIIEGDQVKAQRAKWLAMARGCNCGWISTTNDAYEHRVSCPAVEMKTLQRELKKSNLDLEKVWTENKHLREAIEGFRRREARTQVRVVEQNEQLLELQELILTRGGEMAPRLREQMRGIICPETKGAEG